jgi:uncharacterized membrane protein
VPMGESWVPRLVHSLGRDSYPVPDYHNTASPGNQMQEVSNKEVRLNTGTDRCCASAALSHELT